MNANRQFIAILVLVLSMAVSGCFTGTGTREPSPTATPNSALKGRFLWLAHGKGDALLAIDEYRIDTMSSETLVEGIPHKAGQQWISGVFSEDGNALMVYDEDPVNVVVVDIPNGVIKPLPLPGVGRLGYGGIWGAFSPDNGYLAYALTGYEGHSKSGLYLFNLISGETSTLYEAPCSSYMMAGEVCGAVLDPYWIDKTTLIFNGYKGKMPDKIEVTKSDLNPVGTPQIPSPNRTFVIAINGTILQEFEPMLGDLEIQGTTLLVRKYSDEFENCLANCREIDLDGSRNCTDSCLVESQWFETADIKQGIVKSKSFPLNNSSRFSPDGKFILNYVNDLWHLIDIRGGSDQIVENLGQACGASRSTWSPDGKYIACMGLGTGNLQIVSLEGFPDLSLPLHTTGTYPFVVWVP
ncbi:MAG: hypothetical protein KKB13_16615 [Chloroflexi bacterium]|nr:hypothetical protein [Chloroflexota bacterium]MBU1877336.1 hypothetical protein [Chloroflexota bacterium]